MAPVGLASPRLQMTAHLAVSDDQQLPADLAKFTAELQDRVLAKKDRFNVAISGGSLASTMAKGMVGNPAIKFEKWNVWLADERVVPLDSPDSNYGIFKEQVIDRLPENERPKSFPLDVSKPLDSTPTAELAAEYQQRLVSELGPKPEIDLIFLGMGPDGHTCSLFPGHPLLEEHKLFVAPIDDSPKPPPRRITLTKPTLDLADQLVFVCTGAGKQEALDGVFVAKSDKLPSYQVNQTARNPVVWFCDRAAVAELPPSLL